jgi:DNA-binding Lrp family transcriptional regulator
MAGSADYMLRVAARDLAHYDAIHRDCLARLPGVSSMKSGFSIRTIRPMRGYKCAGG